MDIIDNQNEHTLGTFLAENIQKNSSLSFVTAFFTIFAYHKLKISLDDIQIEFLDDCEDQQVVPESSGIIEY